VSELERRYAAAEQPLETQRARSVRRGPVTLIGVLLVVALAVAAVAVVDLRRLRTPGGAALAWAGAAVYGDCTAFRELSTRVRDDGRSSEERCAALRRATEDNRANPTQVQIALVSVQERGDAATATVRITRRDVTQTVPLQLRPQDDGWAVVLSDDVCALVPCA
jgi:hypothetical protein